MRSFPETKLSQIIFVVPSMKKNLRTQIAERIQSILSEKGLRQQDLADSAGLTKSYVSQIMHGSVNLTLETIESLERALNMPIVVCPK